MRVFNAVGIERNMARFLRKDPGKRGEFYDADVFRAGRSAEMAQILHMVAVELDGRAAGIAFPPTREGKRAKVQLEQASRWLREVAETLRSRRLEEPENLHWEVFGALLAALNGLFERLELAGDPKPRVN